MLLEHVHAESHLELSDLDQKSVWMQRVQHRFAAFPSPCAKLVEQQQQTLTAKYPSNNHHKLTAITNIKPEMAIGQFHIKRKNNNIKFT